MTEGLPLPASGSVVREAWRLSVPATLSLLLHACYRVNDQYWVQKLGVTAQAALGVTSFMLIFNFAFIQVVYSGGLARVARATGARDRDALQNAVHTTLKFGTLWMLLIGLAGYLTTDFWVFAVGATGDTAQMSHDYLSVMYLCFPLLGMKPVVDAIFIGMGNTFIPMLMSGVSVALNFMLNPLLIYGAGDWDGMGIAGAAWATVLARGAIACVGIVLLGRYYGLKPKWLQKLDTGEIWRLCRIGLPIAVSTAGYAGVFIAVLKTTIEPLGQTVQAGLGVGFNGVEAISYCALMGPAVAASSMVGRRLGADDKQGAKESVRACMLLSLAIATVASLVFLLIPEVVVQLYSSDPDVIREAALYLWVVGWSQTITAAQAVYEQALAGAGHTFWMSMLNTAGNSIRIPLCWIFAIQLAHGSEGAWWAMNLTNVLRLAAIFVLYRRGRWMQTAHSHPPA